MNLQCTLYVAALFFILTPGILLSLPAKGSKYMVAATHALVFAVIYHFTHKLFWNSFNEGFQTNKDGCELGSEYKMGKVEKRNAANKLVGHDLVKGCFPITGSKIVPELKCPKGQTAKRDTSRGGLGGWGCQRG